MVTADIFLLKLIYKDWTQGLYVIDSGIDNHQAVGWFFQGLPIVEFSWGAQQR